MGYHVIDPDDVPPTPDRPCVQRALGAAAGLERVALNRYEVEPGERIPLAYHYHDEQEEAFYVLEGELRVETPDRTYAVGAGSLFVVEPGSPQRAFNPGDADSRVDVLALGAPAVEGDANRYDPEP